MHIETEMEYYNSGSSIQGAVFIEALENFRFDALYIRIEGNIYDMSEMNGVNGSRAAPRIG